MPILSVFVMSSQYVLCDPLQIKAPNYGVFFFLHIRGFVLNQENKYAVRLGRNVPCGATGSLRPFKD